MGSAQQVMIFGMRPAFTTCASDASFGSVRVALDTFTSTLARAARVANYLIAHMLITRLNPVQYPACGTSTGRVR
jgi:hypothetical protein